MDKNETVTVDTFADDIHILFKVGMSALNPDDVPALTGLVERVSDAPPGRDRRRRLLTIEEFLKGDILPAALGDTDRRDSAEALLGLASGTGSLSRPLRVRAAAEALGPNMTTATYRRRHRDPILNDVAMGLWKRSLSETPDSGSAPVPITVELQRPDQHIVVDRAPGVTLLTLDFYHEIPWARLMAEASEIDIFFTYGRSWRHTLTKELGEIRDRLNV